MSATLLNTSIPIPTVPIMDVRTGELNQAWFRFFLAVWERTGGAIGTLGVPGGVNGNVQFNANGAFGGLTNAELTTLIEIFTPTLSGAVPASGGGSTKFLRADASFQLIDLALDITGRLAFGNFGTLGASSLFGNPAAGPASGTNIAVGSGLTLTVGGTLSATGAGSGTVTQVDTGALLTGGPITTTGTVSVAAIAASSIIANSTTASAVPTAVPIGSGLSFSSGTLVASGSTGTIIAAGVSLASSPYVLPFVVGRNVPAAAVFTLVNTHSSTIVDNTNGPLVWSCPTAGLGSNSLSTAQWPVPVGSWTYTVHGKFFGGVGALPLVGLSDGTKYDVMNFQGLKASSDGYLFAVQTWSNTTTNVSSTFFNLGWAPEWFRITWNSGTTTRTLQISPDGFTWFVVSTTASPFLTPSQFVIGANIGVNIATTPVTVSLDYLVQT